nr:MAG TPA: hypothetical protein [Caudoviricetes sp.]
MKIYSLFKVIEIIKYVYDFRMKNNVKYGFYLYNGRKILIVVVNVVVIIFLI